MDDWGNWRLNFYRMTRLANLTEETIRARTKAGDTPLHRAAKAGRISEIPKHLLTIELFLVRNNSFYRDTPIHAAAKSGQLDKVPKEFLTKETMTACDTYENGWQSQGRTPTPLERAIEYGHADQIPKEFLTPELRPKPIEHERKSWVALATVEQKDRLRWFGFECADTITKDEAGKALTEYIMKLPEKYQEYNNRPATGHQIKWLRSSLRRHGAEPEDFAGSNEPLSFGQAKVLIVSCAMEDLRFEHEQEDREWAGISYVLHLRQDFSPMLTDARIKRAAEILHKTRTGWTKDAHRDDLLLQKVTELYPGILEEHLKIKCWDAREKLTALFKLRGLQPREEDLTLFRQHGMKSYAGDAFWAYALTNLVRCLEKLLLESRTDTSISMACVAASNDPAFQKATLTLDERGNVAFTWPKQKLQQWFRKGAKF